LLADSFVFTNKHLCFPKGNDANRGTQTKPFASIEKAIAAVRKTPGPVAIYLLQGTYYLKKPIVFTSTDSRKENEPLTITSFKNQEVIINGGVPLNLKWEKYKKGIRKANVKPDLIFDELFVYGQLQRMARYLNFDSTAHFLEALRLMLSAKKKLPDANRL
jgi:hypothetical protein